MSLETRVIADFKKIAAGLASGDVETLTHTRTGPETETEIDEALVFRTTREYGDPAVAGYNIDELTCRFLCSELSYDPKQGDIITRDSVNYEVTGVEKLVRDTQWKLTCERAFIHPDLDVTSTIQRATLTQNSAKAVVQTWVTHLADQPTIYAPNDDVADMILRLGVRGDKAAATFYYAGDISIQPTDRISYGGRLWRITMIATEQRVARLLKVVAELYA